MFSFFLCSLSILVVVKSVLGNREVNVEKNYPSGYELKRQLRDIPIYNLDKVTINLDLIEEYIFRDYVYGYEKISRLF